MTADDADEFTFAALSQLLWNHRLLVAVASLSCALVAGVLAFTAKPIFRAQVVATDVRDRGMGNAGSLATQLGGLASLAGMNLPPGLGAPAQESAAVLESHHLAEEFIRRNGLLPELMRNSGKPATSWMAVKVFKENVLTIRKDQHKGVTTVAMDWTDPATAARWANEYVALANDLIRNRALEDSTRNIAYLNEQVAQTSSVDLRKVMYNIIENETKTLMVAKGRTEYAFEIVDPAVPPELKVGPHRLLMVLIGFTLGFAAGGGIALIRDRFGRHRRGSLRRPQTAEM